MNYREALEQGYKVAFVRSHNGYVSRKVKIDDQPVLVAQGKRKGMLYVETPNYETTGTHYRVYLEKENDGQL